MEVILDLDQWDNSPVHEREKIIPELSMRLSPNFRFKSWEDFSLGTCKHTLAVFLYKNLDEFILIPGYHSLLGYDLNRHELPRELQDEWRKLYNKNENDLKSHISRFLSKIRSVNIDPFLIEKIAKPQAIMQEVSDGRWEQERSKPRHIILNEISSAGFRFPTNDEWEYSCSGGNRSLFRWGEVWPPIKWTPATLRTQNQWREDIIPNAFGLLIGRSPYELEFCLESNVMRGGDGGMIVSSDVGTLSEWFTLSTPFCYLFKEGMIRSIRNPFLRRVKSII